MLFQKRKGNDNTFSSTRDRRYTYSFARYHPKFFQFPYNLISNDKIIRHVKIIQHDEEKKKHTCYPPFSSSIQASWPTHLEAIIEGKERKRRERRERMESRRKAARGKENLATLFFTLPSFRGARVESPLATVYWTHANIHGNEGPPWEATPSLLRISGWSASCKGIAAEERRREGRGLWEKFPFDPIPSPRLP